MQTKNMSVPATVQPSVEQELSDEEEALSQRFLPARSEPMK